MSGCENGNSNDNIVIKNSKSSSSIIKHLEIINSINLSPPHLLPSRTSSEDNTHSCFDKVDIPPQFIGKVFGSLFRSLFETEGAVAIALYRYDKKCRDENSNDNGNDISSQRDGYGYGSNKVQGYAHGQTHGHGHGQRQTQNQRRRRMMHKNPTDLPTIITCPPRDTVLQLHDEIFILRATHRHL